MSRLGQGLEKSLAELAVQLQVTLSESNSLTALKTPT